MKKPKFNIGDKVKTTVYGSIEGIEVSVEVQWYICSINCYMSPGAGYDTIIEYTYDITKFLTHGHPRRNHSENELTLVEKVQYDSE